MIDIDRGTYYKYKKELKQAQESRIQNDRVGG